MQGTLHFDELSAPLPCTLRGVKAHSSDLGRGSTVKGPARRTSEHEPHPQSNDVHPLALPTAYLMVY